MKIWNMPIRSADVHKFFEIFERLELRHLRNPYWANRHELRVSFELPTIEIQRDFEESWARMTTPIIEITKPRFMTRVRRGFRKLLNTFRRK